MDIAEAITSIKFAKEAIKWLYRQGLKRKADGFTSKAIQELLKADPNLNAAQAKLKAYEATGVVPSEDYFQAQTFLQRARSSGAKKKKTTMRRSTTRKITAKRRPKRKVAAKKR